MQWNAQNQKYLAQLRLHDASRPFGVRAVSGNSHADVAAAARQADE